MSHYHKLKPEDVEVGDIYLMTFMLHTIYPGIITQKDKSGFSYETLDGGGVVQFAKWIPGVILKKTQSGLEIYVGDIPEPFEKIFEKLK